MTGEWKERIQRLLYRDTKEDDLEFVALVDLAVGRCDLETCKVLMSTFVRDDDFGVQESVVSALSTAKQSDYQVALLEELPRLMMDAPQWAEVLVEREIKYNLGTFQKTLKEVPQNIRDSLNALLRQDYFRKEYPHVN